jgi:glycosyltransferase involved in cell wall biosynthesis
MHQHARRLVWVTFDFPPRMSSGVFRPVKIYKYLDKDRFAVDFITHGAAARFERAAEDPSLLADLTPSPTVHRVPTLIPHDGFGRLRGMLRGRPAATSRAASTARDGAPSTRGDVPPRLGLRGRLYRQLAMVAYFPDHLFIWGWIAAVLCVWRHLRRRYDVVYTTSYPESAHLPGIVLHSMGVRWVVDYRYGGPMWIKHLAGFRKPNWRDRLDCAFQRLVLSRADHVITQSEPMRADFCRAFGIDAEKISVIPNGFDEHDFAPPASPAFAKQSGEVHLMHVGAMEGLIEAERGQLADALNGLADDLRAAGRRLVLHTVGRDEFGALSAAGRLRFDYQPHGTVVHHQLAPFLAAADAFLLSTITTASGHNGVAGFIPGKLWEYLRAGGPILMAGPRDSVWSVIEQARVGVHLDVSGATRVDITDLLARLDAKQTLHASVGLHTWEARARLFQRVLDCVVDAPGRAVCIGEGSA